MTMMKAIIECKYEFFSCLNATYKCKQFKYCKGCSQWINPGDQVYYNNNSSPRDDRKKEVALLVTRCPTCKRKLKTKSRSLKSKERLAKLLDNSEKVLGRTRRREILCVFYYYDEPQIDRKNVIKELLLLLLLWRWIEHRRRP